MYHKQGMWVSNITNPPRDIVREVQRIDPRLRIVLQYFPATEECRWVIYREDKYGEYHHVFSVQNDDNSYRPLDQRVIFKLHDIDMWNYRNTNDHWNKRIIEPMERQKNRIKSDLDEKTDNVFNENKWGQELMVENIRNGKGPFSIPQRRKSRKIFSYKGQRLRREAADEIVELGERAN